MKNECIEEKHSPRRTQRHGEEEKKRARRSCGFHLPFRQTKFTGSSSLEGERDRRQVLLRIVNQRLPPSSLFLHKSNLVNSLCWKPAKGIHQISVFSSLCLRASVVSLSKTGVGKMGRDGEMIKQLRQQSIRTKG